MKKVFLTMAAMAVMAVTISTSFAQEPDKQSQKARENLKEEQKDVVDAKMDLKVAKADSASDIQKFRKESNLKIKDNEKSIADLKVNSSKVKAQNKVTYDKKVGDLEKENNKLKKDLADYKEGSPSKWTSFKTEFNHDMNELGTALKDLTVNNKL
jgi:hypothetical protein